MVKKCIYCKCDVAEESVIDFCERCGKGVFGDKMFNAIIQNIHHVRIKTLTKKLTIIKVMIIEDMIINEFMLVIFQYFFG